MVKYELTNSGIEWLEEIPNHWGVTSIKKEFQVIPSNVDKKTEDDEAEVKLCNYVDVYYNDFITSDIDFMVASATDNEINKFQLKIGDVLITKDSEDPLDIAVPALVKHSEDKLLCGYHLSMIRSINNRIEGSYLFWALKDEFIVTQLWREACGVTRWAIASRHIKNSTIPFPPKPEQIAIANYLNKACSDIDRVVEIKRKQIENLQYQLKSIIQHTVTKGLNPKAEMKESGIDWIGEVPKHWKIIKFSQIISLKHGYQFRENDFTEDGLKVVKITQLKPDGTLDLNDASFIDETRVEEFKDIIIERDDVLMALTGGTIGKIIWVNEVSEKLVQNYRVGNFYPVNKKLNKRFMFWVLSSEFILFQIFQNLKETGQPNIGKEDFNRMKILLPERNEQNYIAEYLDKVSGKMKSAQFKIEKQIEVLLNYKISLIHEVVTGKKQIYNKLKV